MITAFYILALLQIKHWLVDFVLQTDEEIRWKGQYFDWRGAKHSVKHGATTGLVLLIMSIDLTWAVWLSLLDFVAHYHIDWIKMNWGNQDIRTPQFWQHLGLDQMAHQLTYIGIVATIIVP
jgi:hypothetical protein